MPVSIDNDVVKMRNNNSEHVVGALLMLLVELVGLGIFR